MPTYTYSDWRRRSLYPTAALQYDRLVLHIEEVTALIGPESSADGFSESANALVQYLNQLQEKAGELEVLVGRGNPVSHVRMGRAK